MLQTSVALRLEIEKFYSRFLSSGLSDYSSIPPANSCSFVHPFVNKDRFLFSWRTFSLLFFSRLHNFCAHWFPFFIDFQSFLPTSKLCAQNYSASFPSLNSTDGRLRSCCHRNALWDAFFPWGSRWTRSCSLKPLPDRSGQRNWQESAPSPFFPICAHPYEAVAFNATTSWHGDLKMRCSKFAFRRNEQLPSHSRVLSAPRKLYWLKITAAHNRIRGKA